MSSPLSVLARAAAAFAVAGLALGTVLALGGCSFGFGSSFVGQWKPRRHVDFEACLREPGPPGAPVCKERKEVVTDVPGRRFWGVILPMLQLGVSSATYQGESSTLMRVQPSIEVLRGHGRWAYGVRTGVVTESEVGAGENSKGMAAWDVTAVGHVSLLERLSLYGGLGYLPYSGLSGPGGTGGPDGMDGPDGPRTSLGGRGLLGAQLALSKTHSESYIVLILELDHLILSFDETYRSTGLSGHIGLFF